jgi:hypothetical protein
MDGRIRDYPPDVFPKIWERVESLISEGRGISPEEVWKEINRRSDEMRQWAKSQSKLFVPLDLDQTVEATKILKTFARLVDTRRGRSRGDPFVVALAKLRGCTVVTGEEVGSQARPKIPFVCSHYGVECIMFLKMMQLESWVFG